MENEELKQDVPVEDQTETVKKEDKSAKKKVGKKSQEELEKALADAE